MMLTRSLVAVLCGALAVASLPGQSQPYPYEEYNDAPAEQWIAHLDKPRPGMPKPGFPVPPKGDYPPPREPPVGMPKFPFPPPPEGEEDEEHPHEPPHGPPPPPPGAPHEPPQGPPGEWPHPSHHHHPKVDDKTIFQALGEDKRFSRIYKLVNYTEDIVSILNDSSKSVTFFAPPDRALRPPKHHGKHGGKHEKDTAFDEFGVEAFFSNDVIRTEDELELFSALEGFVDEQVLASDDDEDKERKKKIIKKILTAVLKYHILPEELPAHELAKNTTFPTSLTLGDGSLHSQPLRLRVEQPPRLFKPTLSLNFYAKVLYADVKTKNGLIHVVNHPLFPPPSTFTTLFAFSDVFSTLSSAIQRVGLLDDVDWHWNKDSKTLEGNPAVTIFAPTNDAFKHLPFRLKLFLFSPLGHRALKKILSYHVVPDLILHTNWVHNATDEDIAVTFDEDNTYSYIPTSFDESGFDFGLDSEPFGGFKGAEVPKPHLRGLWTRPADQRQWAGPHAQPEHDGYGFPGGEYGPPRFPPPPPFGRAPEGPHFPPPPPPFGRHEHPHFPPPPPQHGCPGPRGFPGGHFPPPPPPPHYGYGPEGPHFPPPPPPPPHYGYGPEGPHFPPPPPPFGHPEGPHFPPPPPPPFGYHEGPHFPPPPPPRYGYGPEGPHFPPPPFEHGPDGHRSPPPPFEHGPEGPHFPPPPHHMRPHFPPAFPPPPFAGCGCAPPPPPPFAGCGPLPPPPPFHNPFDHEGPKHKPKHPLPHPKPVYSANATLPTLLANHTVDVRVAQFHSALPHRRFFTVLFVNGQYVVAPDVPARNGAVHVVRRLIKPRGQGKKHGPEHVEEMLARGLEGGADDWEDWEEWLPQWAEEE